MFEHKKDRVLSRPLFVKRVARHLSFASLAVALALGMGVGGYHYLGRLGWLDSLVNASMILGGMGPVDRIETTLGKYFASFYALFSGLFFIGVATIIVAPFAHRFLHRLHVDESSAG